MGKEAVGILMNGSTIIREVTVRHCKPVMTYRGKYTDGATDPDLVYFFVTISDGQATGYGECTPTSIYYQPGHIGRSNIDEWSALIEICNGLIGKDIFGLGNLLPKHLGTEDFNSIIDAVDFALHDLVGKKLNIPVAVLLGGLAKPYVWGMPVVHTDSPPSMAAKAGRWHREYGFKYFKLKPIGNKEADVETLRLMREQTGPDVKFYMDANYALVMGPEEVINYINELSRYGLIMYEDPINCDLAGYGYIRRKIKAGLMLDEKARFLQNVLEIIQAKCADQINIHANWAGGFQAGIERARVAAAGGLTTMIGSTYYIGPGIAAYQILSSLLPGEVPCEQVNMEVYGMRNMVTEPFATKDGKIFISNRPGLGVEPDMHAVAGITVGSVKSFMKESAFRPSVISP